MAQTEIRAQMQQRRDTAANWTSENPMLLSGEFGYETDTGKFKIGDGSTRWDSLDYLPIPSNTNNLDGDFTVTGDVGIGTTSPVSNLQVEDSTGAASISIVAGTTAATSLLEFGDPGDRSRGLIKYDHSDDSLSFRTSGISEDFRIDSAGNLLVGTSTSIATVDHSNSGFTPQTQVANQGGISSALLLANFRNNNSVVPQLVLQKARGNFETPTTINSDDTFGAIDFNGYDGSSYLAGAIIKAEVDGTPSANDMPGRLVFSVTADGANSPTEAMRIKNTRVINFSNVLVYADNAAAKADGLVDGDVYRTSTGDLKIVYT